MGSLWRRSGTVERDTSDDRADGALAYFYVGGTTTPYTVYTDAAETTPHTAPVEADQRGRWPDVFIPFCDAYDEKVTTSAGTQLNYTLLIPNANPVDVAVGAVTTASEQILQTGDFLFTAKSGTRSGFVRANGRTIGSGASGATERANDDTVNLYTFLYNNFANGILAVTGGRGASAAADFAANKPIALFNGRGATLRGLDDMGNTAASLLGSATFQTGNATTGGSVCGENTHVLLTAELAAHTHGAGTLVNDNEHAHTHSGTTNNTGSGHVHTIVEPASGAGHSHSFTYATTTLHYTAGGTDSSVVTGIDATSFGNTSSTNTAVSGVTTSTVDGQNGKHTHGFDTGAGSNHKHTITGSAASNGSDTAHNNVSRSILGNILIKL